MEQSNSDVKLGRFLSLVLRHDPKAAGITLDEHGWADVRELLDGVRRTGRKIDLETLERIVRENNKKRYSFNEDHTKIRANQGHSIPVDVELKQVQPPRYLYHGTATRFLDQIQAKGIRRMGRQYVHLSGDFETAVAVGKRHGTPAVLTIDAAAMARDGFPFYLSENGVWLCEEVPAQYFVDDEGEKPGMERVPITIDGTNFSTLEEFYDEIDRLLTRDLGWRTGHNLDAFNDLLRGGFGVHEYGQGLEIRWINAAKSRRDFGYPAAEAYWQSILERCHPSNRGWAQENLQAAQRGEGQTLFDLLVEIILDSDGSGHDCTLTLED